MIKSMTAFAKQQMQSTAGLICWEIRSVNQRFLDINFRLPEAFRDMEWQLRESVRKYLQRGKIEISLRYQAGEQSLQKIILNKTGLQEVCHAISEISNLCPQQLNVDALKLLAWPGVIQTNESDVTEIKKQIMDEFIKALQELEQTRAREGNKLAELIVNRLDLMAEQVVKVREAIPLILVQQKQRLTERLQEIQINCAPERLEQEIALLIQKSDVMEELDRLETHIAETRRVLKNSESVGRRLDFLAQEMHREANTLGAKSIHIILSQASLELKILIEQIREQVQNIE